MAETKRARTDVDADIPPIEVDDEPVQVVSETKRARTEDTDVDYADIPPIEVVNVDDEDDEPVQVVNERIVFNGPMPSTPECLAHVGDLLKATPDDGFKSDSTARRALMRAIEEDGDGVDFPAEPEEENDELELSEVNKLLNSMPSNGDDIPETAGAFLPPGW